MCYQVGAHAKTMQEQRKNNSALIDFLESIVFKQRNTNSFHTKTSSTILIHMCKYVYMSAHSCAKVYQCIILSCLVIRIDRTYIFNHRLQACWQSFCIGYVIAEMKFKSLLGTRQSYIHKFTSCHSYARLGICGKLRVSHFVWRKKRFRCALAAFRCVCVRLCM